VRIFKKAELVGSAFFVGILGRHLIKIYFFAIIYGMKREGYKKLVNYWQETAKHDYKTMKSLFAGKRYDASLFFAHIVLEKILKALVVEKTKDHVQYTHNLVKLAEVSKIELDEKELNLLKDVNEFNIEARYPEQKLQFYKLCTKAYAGKYIKEIDKLYKKLCLKLKPKR